MGGAFPQLFRAWRTLWRRPGFLVVSVLTLALGVGSVSAIYSVVDGVLLSPLPYPQAGQILRLHRVQQNWSGPVSAPAFRDWQEATRGEFAALAAFTGVTLNLTGEGEAERIVGYRVSPAFWDVMGLGPAHGRWFSEAEDAAAERVAVLGHGFWQRRFGGSTAVLGRSILLNGEPHTVVGIAPESFRYPGDSSVYLPLALATVQASRGNNYLSVIGRLRDGVDREQATAALGVVNARLAQEYPENHEGLGARATPLPELLNSSVRNPLLVLLGAAALVLLITCANLANLLLARAGARRRELAVRAALGAGRGELARGVLTEALVIALAGGALGVALAWLAVPLLMSLAPGIVPSHAEPGVNLQVVLVSLAASVATVLGFAAWPAWRAGRAHPGGALQEEGRAGAGGRDRARARAVLVVAEVALSLTLLVGAGLLIESLRQLGRIDPGVDLEHVLTASFVVDGAPELPGEDPLDWYQRHTQVLAGQFDAVIERLSAIPGVEAVAISDALPLSGKDNSSSDITVVGTETPAGQSPPGASWRFVNPGFFRALGMRVVQGRDFVRSDDRPGDFPAQVLVNETFARRYLDGNAVGRQLVFLGDAPKEVVGVVSDARLLGLERDPVPEVYMPLVNATRSEFDLALRVRGDPGAYALQLREALREVDPDYPVFAIRGMDRMVAESLQLRRFNLVLMSVFSAVALLLAAIGLYGVIAYAAIQRTHEFGIRLSLGAAPRRLLGMVLGQGLRLVLAGLAIGLAGAVLLGRLLASQLYGVAPLEPLVLAQVSGLLLLAGLAACLLPAWRASRVPPSTALRDS